MKVIILYVIAMVFVVNGYSQQMGTKKYKRVPILSVSVYYPDGTPVDSIISFVKVGIQLRSYLVVFL